MRLQDWNYSSEGVYFITICCKNRYSFFGKIEENKVKLSEIGEVALRNWQKIPDHFNHVRLDEFVIMPNHIHGLLILDYTLVPLRDGMNQPTKPDSNNNTTRFSKPVKNSVSVIINQYKSSIKRWCNLNEFKDFQWQPRFYDEILKNEIAIDSIRDYINSNPRNWNGDLYYFK